MVALRICRRAPLRRRAIWWKRLRAAVVPGANIIVGRWAPPSLADGHTESILGAGAAYVSTSLLETREQLYQFVALLTRQPMPAQPEVRVPDAA